MKFPSLPWFRRSRPESNLTGSRERILSAVRAATENLAFQPKMAQPLFPVVADVPGYGLVQAMAERFGAELTRISGTWELADSMAAARMALLVHLKSLKPSRALLWSEEALPIPGLRQRLEDEGITCLGPGQILTPEQEQDWSARVVRLEEVAQIDLGISGADAAIAATGTVVIRSGRGQNRLASLLPDRHIVLVPWSRLYPTLESWLTELRQSGRALPTWQEVSNVTFITGPSRTGDIEGQLILGAHGPKAVHVILFNNRA